MSKFEDFKNKRGATSVGHESADTDVDVNSLHHTLGSRSTQAAPGNHKHTDYLKVADAKVQDYVPSESGISFTVKFAKWWRIGDEINVQVAGTIVRTIPGDVLITLPVPAASWYSTSGYDNVVGVCFAHNPGVAVRTGVCRIATVNRDAVSFHDSNSPNSWGGTYPWTWDAGDEINFQIKYMADPSA